MTKVMHQTLVGCISHSLGSLYHSIHHSTDGSLQLQLLQSYPTLDVITLVGGCEGDRWGEVRRGRKREGETEGEEEREGGR